MKKFFQRLSGLDLKKASINLRDEEGVVEEELEDADETTEEEYYENEDTDESKNETEDDGDEEIEDEEEDDGVLDKEEKEWLEQNEYEEGQLSIDVFQTPDNIVVKSTIAGVKPGDIDISINNDMLTIRGKRTMQEEIKEKDYLFRECYWGSFSRSVILPVEVESDKIEAFLENGVLTITLPKARHAKQISIKVKEK